MNYRDEKPFAALARVVERRLSDFNQQEVANTARAFATVNYRDEKLFAALARAAERCLRYAAHSSRMVCVGAILMECEQRALRDSELALLKALEGVMSGYDAELAFRTATKYAIASEQAKRAECCAHSMGVCNDEQSG